MKDLALYNTESIDELVWPAENLSLSKNTPALTLKRTFAIIYLESLE